MRRTHLPIADPCHEDWDAMDPVERGRFCRSCDKQVYDLSSMTEREARSVLRAHAGGNLCVRYCHDSAGNIRFRPARPARAAALALAMAACTPHERPDERQQVVGAIPADVMVMGTMEEPPPEAETGREPVDEIEMGDVPAPDLDEPLDEPEAEPDQAPEPRRILMGRPVRPPQEVKGDIGVSDDLWPPDPPSEEG